MEVNCGWCRDPRVVPNVLLSPYFQPRPVEEECVPVARLRTPALSWTKDLWPKGQPVRGLPLVGAATSDGGGYWEVGRLATSRPAS